MSAISSLAVRYQRYRDECWLALYIVLILGSGLVIGSVVSRAFGGYSGFRESLRNVVSVLPVLDLVGFVSIIIGIYLGLLALLFLDFKKRIQSVLLGIGTLLSFLIIWSEGVMFTAMGATDYTIIFLAGLLVIYLVGGSELRRLTVNPDNTYRMRAWLTTEGDNPVEFPTAARILKLVLAGFIGLALFEAYTTYQTVVVPAGSFLTIQTGALETFASVGGGPIFARDVVFSVLFIGAFWRFLDYDAGKRVVFIGPPRSGKTHLILGLYTQAQDSNYNPRGVSGFITSQKEYMINNRDWAPATEEQTHKMGFNYTSKSLFSKNVRIDGLDYPGEYSYYIPDGLELLEEGMQLPSEPIDNPIEKLPPGVNIENIGEQLAAAESTHPMWEPLIENGSRGFEQQYIERIANIDRERDSREGTGSDGATAYLYLVCTVLPRVRNADTLAFIYDVSQYRKWERDGAGRFLDIEYYQRIVDLSSANKSIGIATKSDTVIDEFVEDRRIDPRDNHKEFQEYINERLLNSPYRGAMQALQMNPIPVYIHNDDDTPEVPTRTYGMEQVIEKLGE